LSRQCSADKRCTASGCTSECVRRVSDLREDTGGPQPPPVAPGLKGRDNRALTTSAKRRRLTGGRRGNRETQMPFASVTSAPSCSNLPSSETTTFTGTSEFQLGAVGMASGASVGNTATNWSAWKRSRRGRKFRTRRGGDPFFNRRKEIPGRSGRIRSG
jgi:hypothetical protein